MLTLAIIENRHRDKDNMITLAIMNVLLIFLFIVYTTRSSSRSAALLLVPAGGMLASRAGGLQPP